LEFLAQSRTPDSLILKNYIKNTAAIGGASNSEILKKTKKKKKKKPHGY
jgi:hypothetical protein